jgi:hypothetical protein
MEVCLYLDIYKTSRLRNLFYLSLIVVMIISPGNFGVPNIASAGLLPDTGKAGPVNQVHGIQGMGILQTGHNSTNGSANVIQVSNTVNVSQISLPKSLVSLSNVQINDIKIIPFRQGPQNVSPQSSVQKSADIVSVSTPQPSVSQSITPLVANQYSGFEGSDYPASCFCAPPDGNLAVGPNNIFEIVNLEGKIWSKSGILLSTFPTTSFFNTGSLFTSDPRIVYDNQSGHWFGSILATDTVHNGSIKVAVSMTSDPTGGWWIYTLGSSNVLPDIPRMGVTDDKVTIVASDFPWTGGWTGDEVYTLNKSQMIAGGGVNFVQFSPDNSRFHIEPAVYPVSGQADQWMVQDGSSGATAAEYLKISGLPGVSPVTYSSMFTLPIALTRNPPGANQPGTATLVATNDAKIISVSMRGSIMTWTAGDACTPSRGGHVQSCIRWDTVNTSGIGSLLQDIDFGSPGKDMYFPAVSQDATQSFGLVFDFSSKTEYPSIGFTGQSSTDPFGSVNNPVLVKAGTGPDTTGRHGDFHATRADPFTPGVYYSMVEYNTQGSPWNTFISVNSISSSTASVHTTSLAINPIANMPWGMPIAVTGKMVDLSAGNIGIGGQLVTFTASNGTVSSTFTNTDGTFNTTGTSPNSPKSVNINANYAGTQFFAASSSPIVSYNTTKHTVGLFQYTIGNIPYGKPITLIANLYDLSIGGVPVSSKNITWSGSGVTGTPSALTDIHGNAINTINAKFAPASWIAQANFAGDSNYNSTSSTSPPFSTTIHQVRLILWAPLNVTKGSSTIFGATMIDNTNSVPLAGKKISFAGTGIVGGPINGTTNSNGDVVITGTAPTTVGTWKVQASFGGLPNYSPGLSIIKSYHTS